MATTRPAGSPQFQKRRSPAARLPIGAIPIAVSRLLNILRDWAGSGVDTSFMLVHLKCGDVLAFGYAQYEIFNGVGVEPHISHHLVCRVE